MTDLESEFQSILHESVHLDVAALKSRIADLMNSGNYYKRQMIMSFAPKGMYRARCHNSLYGNRNKNGIFSRFKNENEFWNPPASKCSLGRCNDKNESILYCTNDSETAILETKPTTGFITLSVFKPKGTGGSRAMYVGEDSLAKDDTIKHLFKNSQQDPQLKELDIYLDKLFYSDVSNQNEHLYKVSAAVAKNLLSNLVTENGTERTMQALLYSSVAKNHKTFNFVLKPNHAVHLYRLERIQTLEILENNEEYIKLKLMRIGQPISRRNHPLENPKIKWVGVHDGEVWDIQKPKLG